MLKHISLEGKEHSLVNKKKAKSMETKSYRQMVLRRAIPHMKNIESFETWSGDKEIRQKGKDIIKHHYEKIHGTNNLLPVSFLRKGVHRLDAVCRIVIIDGNKSGLGTGFLLQGGFIMTNNHVLSSKQIASYSYAEFKYEDGHEHIKVHLRPDALFVTNEDLDYTIVACKIEELGEIIPIILNPNPALIAKDEFVSIIQHPKGRRKEVSLQDNLVVYVYDKVVRYRTDTQRGSSGSPVFNKNWDLVALHHAGWFEDEKEEKAINEGILISTIVQDLKKKAHSINKYRDSARNVINTIDENSPVLGFFDIHGLLEDVEDQHLEVEVPVYKGSKKFLDVGFWNIEHFNNDVPIERIKSVAKVFSNLSLDIYGLVEVEKEALDKLIKELHKIGISLKYEYLDAYGSQDLAVLYDDFTTKVTKRDDLYDRYKDLFDSETQRGKTAFPRNRYPLIVECEVNQNDSITRFILIVVHLKAFGDSSSKRRRKLASDILATVIDDLRREEDVPIMLGGDFNQKLDNSNVLNSLTKAPDLFTLTMDDSKNNAITYVGNNHRSLIDHIIVSNDIKLGEISNDDAAIVRLDKSVRKYTKDISDHVPVVCRIIYNDGAAFIEKPIIHEPSPSVRDDYNVGITNSINSKTVFDKNYYDSEKDTQSKKEYYKQIQQNALDTNEGFFQLNRLIERTHFNRYSYRTARLKYLYPIVDLRENGKLKSIYKASEEYYTAEHFITMDFEIERSYEAMKESLLRSGGNNLELFEDLEQSYMYNCEHVVPQSWFSKREPMKSDLHHLFTCEPGCNSSRGNKEFYDFVHYKPEKLEGLRQDCGFGEDERFEPESGKGAAARATLYFIIRYPKIISRYSKDELQTLLNWHKKFPVDVYELHRNAEIFKIQGNRNPLIDFPKKMLDFKFENGLR